MDRRAIVILAVLAAACGTTSGGDGGTGGGSGGDDPCSAPDCVVRVGNGTAHGLVYDSLQRPVVAFSGGDDLNLYGVRRLEGGLWKPVGDTLEGLSFAAAGSPRLLLDAQDRPVLAYGLAVGNLLRIRVVRFVGASWETIGELEGSAIAGFVRVGTTFYLAANSKGLPTVFVWSEGAAAWTPTTVSAAGSFAPYPATGVFAGTPHLVYRDVSASSFKVFAFGSGVTQVGESIVDDGRTRMAGLVELGGQLVLHADVGAADGGVTRQLRPLRQNASAWEVLPSPSPERGKSGALAVVNGALVAAFPVRSPGVALDDPFIVSKWNGTGWTQVDSFTSENTGLAGRPQAAAQGASLGFVWESPGGGAGFRINYRVVAIP